MAIYSLSTRSRQFKSIEDSIAIPKVGKFSVYTKSMIYVLTLILSIVIGVNTPWIVTQLTWYFMMW